LRSVARSNWSEENNHSDFSSDPSIGYSASNKATDSDGRQGDSVAGSTLKASRFSKFAPDASLPADEFRAQLRENMKANLEERRRREPNRGNQPAKSYLDSL
jgi:hypothetical protein